MISASGSNPLERRSKRTLILRVIQLMNDPGPEALADPTLIMLREPHLGGAGVCVCVLWRSREWEPGVGGGVASLAGAREREQRAAGSPREPRGHYRWDS